MRLPVMSTSPLAHRYRFRSILHRCTVAGGTVTRQVRKHEWWQAGHERAHIRSISGIAVSHATAAPCRGSSSSPMYVMLNDNMTSTSWLPKG